MASESAAVPARLSDHGCQVASISTILIVHVADVSSIILRCLSGTRWHQMAPDGTSHQTPSKSTKSQRSSSPPIRGPILPRLVVRASREAGELRIRQGSDLLRSGLDALLPTGDPRPMTNEEMIGGQRHSFDLTNCPLN